MLKCMYQCRVIMGANIAGIYGAQIFRSDDKPLYRRGFGINIAVLSVGLALAVFRFVDSWLLKRRAARTVVVQEDSASDQNSQQDVKHGVQGSQPSL